MKHILRILALVMALCMILATLCSAWNPTSPTDRTKLHVRVNGYEVDFPDAQPYIDENGRTMIPLRFATEALGADVTWEQSTKTASIAKDGIVVKVTIGKDTISVTESGSTQYVVMNTTAVLKEGRTYVPIRFVAEALGAYVDYSASYKTVGIYQDVLTAEEITKLHEYSVNSPFPYTYDEAVAAGESISPEDYRWEKEYLESFASAREMIYDYHLASPMKYVMASSGITVVADDPEPYYDAIIKEAVAELAFKSEGLTVEFRSDTSSVYGTPNGSDFTFHIRGYLVISNTGYNQKDTFDRVSEQHFKWLNRCTKLPADNGKCERLEVVKYGETAKIPVDVQVEARGSSTGTYDVVAILILDQP